MKEPSTTSLLDTFDQVTPENVEDYLKQHGKVTEISVFYSEYIKESGIHISDIVKTSSPYISRSYIYDLLNGVKTNPSRNVTLIIAICAHMNRKQTRRLLEIYCHRDLYIKDPRDIIIATYINNANYSIADINEKLASHQLPLLELEERQS